MNENNIWSLKREKITWTQNKQTRPLKDLAKESLFNIILHTKKFETTIHGSNILDLFSGVGSFGLECLSRGSSFVTFVENYKEVIPILIKNISNLNYKNNSQVIEKNVFKDLNFEIFNKKFDIIFMDPPYKEKDLTPLLEKINNSKILSNKGIIIIHRHKSEKKNLPEQFKIVEQKTYGVSKIIFGNFY